MAGWLAGLDAFVVGLAYLGALLASRFVVRPLLLSLFGSAPVIGGWLRSQVDSNLGNFERTITPAANASMGTIISALDWLTSQGRGVLNGVSSLADATYSALYHLGAETIGHAVGVSERWVESLVEAARGYALGLFRQAEYDAKSFLGQAEADAVALTSAVRSEARSEVQAAERVVLDEIRKAEQATGELFTKAEYDAGQLVAASEVRAAELVAVARKDFQDDVAAVEHDLQQLGKAVGVAVADTTAVLGGDIQAAESRLDAALAGVESGLSASIDSVIKSGPWAGLVAAYEGGEAALAADVETLVREGLKQLRAEIADANALRLKYGPAVRAELAKLRGAL